MMDSCGFVHDRALREYRADRRALCGGVGWVYVCVCVFERACVWVCVCKRFMIVAPVRKVYESARRAEHRRLRRSLFMFIARNGFLI